MAVSGDEGWGIVWRLQNSSQVGNEDGSTWRFCTKLGLGRPGSEIRWAIESTRGGDVLTSEEGLCGRPVQSIRGVDSIPTQVVEGVCTGGCGDSGDIICIVPPTEVILVKVMVATLSTTCCQRLRYVCFQKQTNNDNPQLSSKAIMLLCVLLISYDDAHYWWHCHGPTASTNEQLLPYYWL